VPEDAHRVLLAPVALEVRLDPRCGLDALVQRRHLGVLGPDLGHEFGEGEEEAVVDLEKAQVGVRGARAEEVPRGRALQVCGERRRVSANATRTRCEAGRSKRTVLKVLEELGQPVLPEVPSTLERLVLELFVVRRDGDRVVRVVNLSRRRSRTDVSLVRGVRLDRTERTSLLRSRIVSASSCAWNSLGSSTESADALAFLLAGSPSSPPASSSIGDETCVARYRRMLDVCEMTTEPCLSTGGANGSGFESAKAGSSQSGRKHEGGRCRAAPDPSKDPSR